MRDPIFDEAWNGLNEMQNFVINRFLLEFMRELTESLYANEQDRRILDNFRKAADNAREDDIALSHEKATKARYNEVHKLLYVAEKVSEDKTGRFTQAQKDAVVHAAKDALKAARHEVLADKNTQTMESFRQWMDKMQENGSLSPDAAMELEKIYQDGCRECSARDKDFEVHQIPIEHRYAQKIAQNLDDQFHERGIGAKAYCLENDTGTAFIHVPNRSDLEIVKALVRIEFKNYVKNNVYTQNSLCARAVVEKQDLKSYGGLTAAEAECLRGLARGEAARCIEPEVSETDKETYTCSFLNGDSGYMAKLIAQAIVLTHGAGQEAGYDTRMEMGMQAHEQLDSFLNNLGTEGDGKMTKAFLLDSDPDKTQEQREKEGHRLYITKDSFTETKKVEKNGKTSLETHTVSREKNPEIYEELLQDAASNFSSHFVFIPEDKAKELDLYQTNFRYTDGLRNYMREMAKPLDDAQKRVTKEMREMQGHEKDFMRWAIRQSDKETPGEILQEIKDNYRNLVSDFAMASHDEIDEKFHADPDKKGYKEPSEAIAVQSRAKHEAVDRRTEMLLQNNGRTLSDHLEDFVNTLTDERHIEVQTPPYWEQQKTILESMIGREESEKYQFNEKQLEERLEALEKGQQESLPGNSIRDTSDHREVNERYYDRLKEDTIKKTLEKHPGMSREDTKVQQFALQRAIVHDVMNMVRYNSEPVLGRDSIRAYNQLDAAIINASWNADGRAIQELTNRELEQHMDEIQKLASASSKAVAAEEKDFGRDDQERG